MGMTINFAAGTVQGFGSEYPYKITNVNAATMVFRHKETSFSILGSLDRITGDLEASIINYLDVKRGRISNTQLYQMKCKPTQRMLRTARRAPLRVITALIAATLAFVQPAFSQSNDRAYFCVVEMSAGLAFDRTSKKWDATTFIADRKFVIRMKLVGSRIEEGKQVSDYDITITDAGTDFDLPCSNNQKVITIHDDDGGFRCGTITEDFFVNIKTLRFLSINALGYVSGQDNNENTPSVSGGTCTKID